jgi:hypothetical protein
LSPWRASNAAARIAHGADADLQGAAIAHQVLACRPMQWSWNRHVRRGEQPALLLLVDQQVEGIDGQLGIAGHVGQFVVHLAEHQDGFAGGAALGDHRQQVEGDVGVAGSGSGDRDFGRGWPPTAPPGSGPWR